MDHCPHCHAGALRRRPVLYAAWHSMSGESAEQFVFVPNVPAWLCDVCGAKIFDADAMAWLAPLLGPAIDVDGHTPASPNPWSRSDSGARRELEKSRSSRLHCLAALVIGKQVSQNL